MFRYRFAAAVFAAALGSAADAATLTYTSLTERWEVVSTAIAGANGSGPAPGGSDSQSALVYSVSQPFSANDADLSPGGGFALIDSFVAQSTVITANAVTSGAGTFASAHVVGSGLAFGNVETELQVEFFSDVDVAFTLSGLVDCSGTGTCFSFVKLVGPQGQVLYDLRSTGGLLQTDVTGTLLANQSYFLWAWSESHANLAGAGDDDAAGSWSASLTTDVGGGGGVPEPSLLALLGAGLGGLAWLGRRRG